MTEAGATNYMPPPHRSVHSLHTRIIHTYLVWLQVDDVCEAWLLVKVKHDTNLVQVRGHLGFCVGVDGHPENMMKKKGSRRSRRRR